ncbi:MAG: DUF3221 domain-containing protein [Bacillota bacterium]
MKRMFITIPIIMLVVLLAACVPRPDSTPTPTSTVIVGIRGKITSRTQTDKALTILVEGEITADTVYDKASVRVTDKTVIQKDALSRAFEMSDLTVGTTVEVIFEGPVAESYPVQGTAGVVRILSQ